MVTRYLVSLKCSSSTKPKNVELNKNAFELWTLS